MGQIVALVATPEEMAFALFETDVPPPSLAIRLGSPLVIPLPAKRGRQGGGSSSSDAGSSSSGGVGVTMDHGLAAHSSTRSKQVKQSMI